MEAARGRGGTRRSLIPSGPLALIACVAVLLTPAALAAHEGGTAAGFLSGVLHPVSGWDHVLAMIAVGIWGAQLGPPAIWVLPITFPLVMALGGMLGLMGVQIPGVEVGIGLSALLLGLMIALDRKPPLWVAALLVGFFAIFHGYAHGAELPPGESGLTYSIGFVLSTGALHALGIAIGLIHKWPWGQRLLRIIGAFIALAGAWFTWSALTG